MVLVLCQSFDDALYRISKNFSDGLSYDWTGFDTKILSRDIYSVNMYVEWFLFSAHRLLLLKLVASLSKISSLYCLLFKVPPTTRSNQDG